MHALFRELAHGKGWPACPEGGTAGPVRFAPYLACPSGTVAGRLSNDGFRNGRDENWAPDTNGNLCGRQVSQPNTVEAGVGKEGIVVTSARPVRADPYNITITPRGGGATVLWFSLSQ